MFLKMFSASERREHRSDELKFTYEGNRNKADENEQSES